MIELIDTCRMCLDSKAEFISLESKFYSTPPCGSYLDAYNFCTNLNADLNDSLPSIICEECAHNLIFVYEFIRKAIRSDQLLRVLEPCSDSEEKKTSYEEIQTEDPIEDSQFYVDNDYLEDEDDDVQKDIEENISKSNEVSDSEQKQSQEECAIKSESEDDDNNEEAIELTCELCSEVFSTLEELSLHYTEHDDNFQSNDNSIQQNPLQTICNSVPSEKIESNYTRTKQAPLKTWCCEICGKFFSTKQKLSSHNLVHTKEKKFACSLCPKRHSTIFKHRDHMKTHENIRDHECEYCKKRFFSKSTLKCHIRLHTGERPYKCKVCGKCFTQASIMKTHAALHTGKTVECKLCSKKFTRSSHLILHQRSHTGERPYLCTFCPNSYKQKSHLTRHLDTHMGVKHTCEICGKNYTKKSSLNAHMYVHMSAKRFKCGECKLEFTTKDKYNRHMKNLHASSKSATTKDSISPLEA